MEGKTVIAIAHRLSTIAAMDRLVVLDEGRISRDGQPRGAARAAAGSMPHLWRRQSGGFLRFEDAGHAVYRQRSEAAE